MEVHKLGQFSIASNAATTFESWEKWKRSLEFSIAAKGIKCHIQKKAILLHRGGPALQDVYASLEQEHLAEALKATDQYAYALNLLDVHFRPTVNKAYERFVFRSIRQGDESIEQFVVRLRHQASNCGFALPEQEIADQVIFGTSNVDFRKQILEKRLEELSKIIELGKLLESVSIQTKQLSDPSAFSTPLSSSSQDAVARVAPTKNVRRPEPASRRQRCRNCGSRRHETNSKECPATDGTCYQCEKKGHFSNCCPERRQRDNRKSADTKPEVKVRSAERERRDDVKLVKTAPVSDSSEDSDYSFAIVGEGSSLPTQLEENRVVIKVGGVRTSVYVDSMASRALFDAVTWAQLRRDGVKFKPAEVKRNLFPYGKSSPIAVKRAVYLQFESKSSSIWAKAYILDESEGRCESILGSRVAKHLNLLHVGENPVPGSKEKTENDAIRRVAEEKSDASVPKTGKLKGYQLIIPEDKTVAPVAQACRRIPFALRAPLREKCQKLLDEDIIERVKGASRWVSNVVPVLKKNGKLRVCVDMRRANQAVLRERFPIPTFDEIVSDFHGAELFSKVDLNDAYHQIELAPESREITTFVTPDGLYRFKRLLFGVKCAPEMFQRIVQDVLRDIPNVRVFFDDIIIFSKTVSDHKSHVQQVLTRLRENGLTINMEKSIFGARQISFLGHKISKNTVEPNDENSSAVRNFEKPTCKKDLQSFLGLVNFVSKFIPHFSTLTAPLRILLKRNVVFRWSRVQDQAFEKLKNSVDSMKAAMFDPSAKTQLLTDASPVGLGAVLLQQKDEGKFPEVIAFASHSLTPAERNYSQIEKEALGLVWGCERFKMYLLGRKFELLTDHKPLEMLFGPKSRPNARLERWIMRIQSFDYTIRHIPGALNIADPFSRLLQQTPGTRACYKSVDHAVMRVAEIAVPKKFELSKIKSASLEDTEITSVLRALDSGTTVPAPYVRLQYELTNCDGILLRGDRIVPPTMLRGAILRQAHEGHPGADGMKRRLRSKLWWPHMDTDVDKFVKKCFGCLLVSRPDPPPPMTRTTLPMHAWEYVAIDHIGPLPSGDYILVVIDYFSRFIELEFTKSTSAKETIRLLWKVFSRHGFPCRLKSDNATAFVSTEFSEFLADYGVIHVTSPPLWPQANGEVERVNRSLLKRLKIAAAESLPLEVEASKFVLLHNTTPHSVTGQSPAQAMFGRQLRDKLPSIQMPSIQRDDIADKDADQKFRGKCYADAKRHAAPTTLQVGDSVLVKTRKTNKLSPTFDPTPFAVTKVTDTDVIIERGTQQLRRSVADVKQCPVPEPSTPAPPEPPTAPSYAEVLTSPVSPCPTPAVSRTSSPCSSPFKGWPQSALTPSQASLTTNASRSAQPSAPATVPTGKTPVTTRSGRHINRPSRFSD